MAKERTETYYNLLDFSLQLDDDPEIAGRGEELFYALMLQYFFKEESREKAVQGIINNMTVPDFFKGISSIRMISVEDIEKMINASTINDTFAGKIIMSKKFLKTFYPHHQPDYKKMPTDIQMEIIDRIKMKNEDIIFAFTKMKQDMENDRKRSLKKLLAMAIRNVHLKTGFPLKPVPEGVESLIRQEYSECDSLFTAEPRIMSNLLDDKKIKFLVKNIFMVKKHNDIVDVANAIKDELRRFESRITRTIVS